MGGVLVYRCRNCGGLSKHTHVPDVSIAIACLMYDTPLPKHWAGWEMAAKVTTHHCNDRETGIADLIGGELDA